MKARAYRSQKHCVLTIDTSALVREYADKMKLTALNSGCTKPFAWERGSKTFLSLGEFPYFERRKKSGTANAIAELAIKHSVPNIKDFVVKVEHIIGDQSLETLYEK